MKNPISLIVGIVIMLAGVIIPIVIWQAGFILAPIPSPRLTPFEAAELIEEETITFVALINDKRLVMYSPEGQRYVLRSTGNTPPLSALQAAGVDNLFTRISVRQIDRPPLLDMASVTVYGVGLVMVLAGAYVAFVQGRKIQIQ